AFHLASNSSVPAMSSVTPPPNSSRPWMQARSASPAAAKEAYEALHGPSKANSARAANASMGNNVNENFAITFTADTASKTGQSERLVQLNAERGEKIAEENRPASSQGTLRAEVSGDGVRRQPQIKLPN